MEEALVILTELRSLPVLLHIQKKKGFYSVIVLFLCVFRMKWDSCLLFKNPWMNPFYTKKKNEGNGCKLTERWCQPGVRVDTAPVPVQPVTWSETTRSERQMIHSERDRKADKESVVEKTLTASRKADDSQLCISNRITFMLSATMLPCGGSHCKQANNVFDASNINLLYHIINILL